VSYGVRLHVWGDYACFTRPELKVERVTYDVMTPSAARGILEAVYWKPSMKWKVDRIHVLKPIQFQTVRRHETNQKIPAGSVRLAMKRGRLEGLSLDTSNPANRTQRASLILRHVAYVIEAHFELTDKALPTETPAKHISMFNRRAASGQCFHQPCLGCREFAANFALLSPDDPLPESELAAEDMDRDLGTMLCDVDFDHGGQSIVFDARLENGAVDVARLVSAGTLR
jgi:CRISPR-associated protein Cas5d